MKPRRLPGPIPVASLLCGVSLTLAAAHADPLDLTQVPLSTLNRGKANVLMMFGNSNSMDEDLSGLAVGSDKPESRSEIARGAVRDLVRSYKGRIDMGLLAYQQTTSGNSQMHPEFLMQGWYDLSYDPARYDPELTGPRESSQKKFRAPNPTSPGDYVYFNVGLSMYGSTPAASFCYSPTARAFDKGEDPARVPWDDYFCYAAKRGTSDELPTGVTSAGDAGYLSFQSRRTLKATDIDPGHGIADAGRFMGFAYVGPTWFSNGSPGKGYVHVPVAPLTSAQASAIARKLGTSQFVENRPFDPAYPLQNAGLAPLEGTLRTALSYFSGRLSNPAEGGPLPAPATGSCDRNFVTMLTNGLPSVTAAGVRSSDTTAMLASLSTAVNNLRDAGVTTYVVGFALPHGVNPSQLQTIADAGDATGSGTVYYATDRATLVGELDEVFRNILRKTGAASAAALNSQSVSLTTRVYQASFNPVDWSGRLLSLPINPATGAPLNAEAATWDAAERLNALSADDRTVITWRPADRRGVAFRWRGKTDDRLGLEDSQIAALNMNPTTGRPDRRGEARLNYLRGDSYHENLLPSRFRTRPGGKLADIVNSAPTFVGPPGLNYADDSYRAFRARNLTRPAMIYVGANDGMLHGFDAGTGVERIAYVPSQVYRNLSQLTSANYGHRFYVDGTINFGDVYYADSWHTVLVSGLGAGGRGIFGLEVTDPAAFSERAAGSIANFEYSDADDADVGYVTGLPNVVKLNNGTWAAVFGNGYNSTGTGKPTLFVVDIQTGALIGKIATGTGSPRTPNALTGVTAIDTDGNRTIDAVYGGDLLGNVWKFDLSDANPTWWSVAFDGAPLYTARDRSGNPQPITMAPEVGRHPMGGYMVYFGTGKYLERADISDTAQNTAYGVRDDGHPVSLPLHEQRVTGTQNVTTGAETARYRIVSQENPDWQSEDGWLIQLPAPGERAVADPILANGRIIFSTSIPAASACYGGTSWLMELDSLSGGQIRGPVLDTNRDLTIDDKDFAVAGRGSDNITSMPGILRGFGGKEGPLEKKYLNQSDGTLATLTERGNPLSNRSTAREELPSH